MTAVIKSFILFAFLSIVMLSVIILRYDLIFSNMWNYFAFYLIYILINILIIYYIRGNGKLTNIVYFCLSIMYIVNSLELVLLGLPIVLLAISIFRNRSKILMKILISVQILVFLIISCLVLTIKYTTSSKEQYRIYNPNGDTSIILTCYDFGATGSSVAFELETAVIEDAVFIRKPIIVDGSHDTIYWVGNDSISIGGKRIKAAFP